MPEAAVASAAASAAVTSQSAAGAGASPTPAAAQSDDEILGIGQEASPAAPAAQPATEGTGAGSQPATQTEKPAEAKPGEAATQEEPGQEVPADLKDIFKAHPELRTAHFAYKKLLDQFGDHSTAEKLITEVATRFQSPEEFATAMTGLEELRTIDERFYGKSPEGQRALLNGMREDDPAAFGSLVETLVSELPAMDPALSFKLGRQLITNTFQEAFKSARNDEERTAIEESAELLLGGDLPWKRQAATEDPARQAVLRDRQAVDTDRQAFQKETVEAFDKATNDPVVKEIIGEIEKAVFAVIPENAPEAHRPGVISAVYTEVNALIMTDRPFAARIGRLYEQATAALKSAKPLAERKKEADAIGKQMQNQLLARLRASEPAIRANVLKRYGYGGGTPQERQQRQEAAASRVDIGGGGAPGTGTVKTTPKPQDVDYRQTSDDDVLAGNFKTRK